MKQENFLKIAMLFVFVMITHFSHGQILNETFDNDSSFTKNESFFTDGSGDYFGIYDPVDQSTNDFDNNPNNTPSSFISVTGNTGNYLIGEDLDAAGGSSTRILTWSNINISGYTDLNISVFLAASTGGFDTADGLTFAINIDDGGYTDVIDFQSTGDGANEPLGFNAYLLNLAFQEITASIAGTGTSMDLRFTVTANSGNEGFAVDELTINGTASSDPTIGFDAATSTQNETNATFNVLIPVTVSNYDGNQIDVSVASSGTAEDGDFTLNTASLSFTSDGSKNISLDINPDIDDYDDETITLTLTETSSVSGLVISQSSHTLTVADDEIAPSIGFDAATSSETETDATFNVLIPVTVSNYSGDQIDVSVASSGTAEGGDFTLNTASLSFTADGSQNISLDINDDTDADEETVILTITETSAVSGLVISQSTHTVTITDDEIPPVPAAGTIFITEFSNDKGGDFNSEFIELFNNSNETVSLNTSKLIRAVADNSSEYVYDFGTDESTADVDVTIPAYGFIIITRGATRAEFVADQGTTLNAAVKYNGGNSQLYFGSKTRRWRLMTGGTANTDDGTLIDDTGAVLSGTRDYQNIFTDTFISDSDANGTPGALEYLLYNGGAWVNSTALDETTTAKDAYIYDDYTVSANAAANNIGINTGNTLIIGASIGLDLNGDLTVNGNVSINSGGSLIVDGTSTGNVTYNTTLGTENWYLMSSPVAGETYDNTYVAANSLAINGTNNAIGSYVTADNTWSYMQTGASATFTPGTGYSVRRATGAGSGTISFTGTINTSDVAASVITGGTDSFNLIGNPFTAYLNSASFLTGNTANLVSETLWVWNQATGNYETKVTVDAFVLAPTQGFFVNASSTSNLSIAESYQTATGNAFQKTAKTEIKLMINDGTNNRFAKVYYLDNATTGFDNGYDGETFGGIANTIDIFTYLVADSEGKKYQVQSLPKSDYENMVIPVGVKAAANSEITFSANALHLQEGLNVYLEDRLNNTFTRLDIENAEYKTTVNDVINENRFYLHTKTASTLSISTEFLDAVTIYKTDNSNLRISGLQKGSATISIFSVLGKNIMNTSFEASSVKNITLPNLASGVYIVKLETKEGSLNKKIILE